MKNTIKIHPYFIEILFVILFLAISSIAVLQIHLATKTISNKNIDTQYAMAAETLYSVNTPEDASRTFVQGGAVAQGNVFRTQYNKDWTPVSSGGIYIAEKRLEFSPTEAGTMATLSITIQKDNSELYTLTAKRYFPTSTNNGRVNG